MVSQHQLESFLHEIECNGMTSFMEVMLIKFCRGELGSLTTFDILQLLSKVSTPRHNEPLDSMLNVVHGIGYSSSDTAWIIDLKLVS